MKNTRRIPSNRGMRKGLSLIEMMIAVILFGVMSMVGFKYYKSFYNSGDITKKTNLGAIVDQASQLSNAYDIYEIQVGEAPLKINDLIADNVQVLSEIPEGIESMTGDANASNTWKLVTLAKINNADATDDIAFIYPLGATANHDKYCQLFNNIVNNTLSVKRPIDSTLVDGYNNVNTVSFCAIATEAINDSDGNEIVAANKKYIVFPKKIN